MRHYWVVILIEIRPSSAWCFGRLSLFGRHKCWQSPSREAIIRLGQNLLHGNTLWHLSSDLTIRTSS